MMESLRVLATHYLRVHRRSKTARRSIAHIIGSFGRRRIQNPSTSSRKGMGSQTHSSFTVGAQPHPRGWWAVVQVRALRCGIPVPDGGSLH